MTRIDIINNLVKKYDYKSYLEIGVRHFVCFDGVNLPVENKNSIDPNYDGVTYKLTSDEAFESMSEEKKWDIIFIDGYHESNQVLRDIQNSLKHLNDGGSIVCHDMLPPKESFVSMSKCGDGYKAFVKLRMSDENLEMYVVDADYGCGVIRRGNQKLYEDKFFVEGYSYFKNNRKNLMNVKSESEFLEMIYEQ